MTDKEIHAKTDLAKSVLDSYLFEYKDYMAWWNGLDRKAQGTVAIAGIILAGALAFARQLSVNTPFYEQILLSVAIVLLLCAIGFAVFTLIVRMVSLPPDAKQIEELAIEILSTSDSANLSDRVSGIVYDQTALWSKCTQDLYEGCRAKANQVIIAQILILVAAILTAVVTISEIFNT